MPPKLKTLLPSWASATSSPPFRSSWANAPCPKQDAGGPLWPPGVQRLLYRMKVLNLGKKTASDSSRFGFGFGNLEHLGHSDLHQHDECCFSCPRQEHPLPSGRGDPLYAQQTLPETKLPCDERTKPPCLVTSHSAWLYPPLYVWLLATWAMGCQEQ